MDEFYCKICGYESDEEVCEQCWGSWDMEDDE